MRSSSRQLIVVAAIVTGFHLAALAADPGYLPVVGPPPLRFAQPPSPPSPSLPTPAPEAAVLPATETVSARVPTTSANATNATVSAKTNEMASGPPSASPETRASAGAPGSSVAAFSPGKSPGSSQGEAVGPRAAGLAPAESDPLGAEGTVGPAAPAPAAEPAQPITPQMFMKYFVPRTASNGSRATALLPVSFVPPQPGLSPSSSATFETVPASHP